MPSRTPGAPTKVDANPRSRAAARARLRKLLAYYRPHIPLLVAGGVLYSTGVIFYVNKRLKFARAIWHGHVVAAAATHWTAVLVGVVLTSQT